MQKLRLEKRDKRVWEFVYPDEYYETMDELEYAIDLMNRGDFTGSEIIYNKLISAYPYYLDAYHHLALSRERQSKIRQALPFWEMAVSIGRRAFPMEFQLGTDKLAWGWVDNRPFLRCLHGLILAKMSNAAYGDALWLAREYLLLDPDDSIGARYIIGEILLTEERNSEFIKLTDQWNDAYFADFLYGRVLAFFRLGEKEKARKALKEAMECLPLVANELAKKRHVRPKDWDERYISLGSEDQAYAYWQEYGTLWKVTEGVLDWLRANLK